MAGIMFCFSIITILWTLYNIGKLEIDKKTNLKEIEHKFLIISSYFESNRHQMLEIMKIVYDKAGETDPQFIKDYEKILESINDKMNKIGDQWVNELNNTLGYETKYKNWREATRYIERIVRSHENQSKYSERD